MNLPTGVGITIRELLHRLRKVVGFDGGLVFDPSKPDGQPRRCLDTSRAREEFGFRAEVAFEEGLRETVDWYLRSLPSAGPDPLPMAAV